MVYQLLTSIEITFLSDTEGLVINAGWWEVCSQIRLSDKGINTHTSPALL